MLQQMHEYQNQNALRMCSEGNSTSRSKSPPEVSALVKDLGGLGGEEARASLESFGLVQRLFVGEREAGISGRGTLEFVLALRWTDE